MLDLTCLCGEVRLHLAKRPDFINACNCTLCSKTGARWGYFGPSEVAVVTEYLRIVQGMVSTGSDIVRGHVTTNGH